MGNVSCVEKIASLPRHRRYLIKPCGRGPTARGARLLWGLSLSVSPTQSSIDQARGQPRAGQGIQSLGCSFICDGKVNV